MKPALKTLLLSFIFVTAAQCVSAEEWRGLTPLKSTLADVVRIYSECSNQATYCEFTIENEDVYIEFSDGQNCSGIPDGTILSIQRELKNDTTFEALGLDKRRFKSFNPTSPLKLGYSGFIDDKSGLLLKTFLGKIFQINYIPGKTDRASCRVYYRKPREFVRIVLPHIQVVESLSCPETSVVGGEKVVIVANYARTGQRIFLTWFSTGGRIIEGPTPRSIFFDTSGLGGKQVTVTVELNDESNHTATGSCSFNVSPPPKPE